MFSLSLVVVSFALLSLLYKYAIYPIFLSPLAKVPNAHWSSPLSPLWILLRRRGEQENRTIHAAHTKYGDIVRLGPNEVSVACVDDGIKTVYSGGFEKWSWYPNQFANYGAPNMFSMAESKPHSIRKRMISNLYSKSFLQSSDEVHHISRVVIHDRLLPFLDKAAAKHEPLDVLELNFSSTMDFIMAYIFGLQNGTNFLQDAEGRQHWLGVYRSRRPYRFWNGEAPGLVSFFDKLGVPIVPKRVKAASSEIEAWTLDKCEAVRESIANPSSQTAAPKSDPTVYAHLSTALRTVELKPSTPDPRPSSPDLNTASELLDHLAAGHETSGIALTYLMYELSLHPEVQGRLHSELLTLSPPIILRPLEALAQEQYPSNKANSGLLPSPRSIDSLPLLHAILMETLRLHAPIPGPQPRITPSPPISIANSPPLPPGVRISSQAYTLHRNASVFPSPLTWNPDRWIDASEAQKAEMGRWFWAFGSGGRMCVGSNFAMQEMKLIVTAVYSNFQTEVADDEGIEQIDAYTAGPRTNRLVLGFERL